MPVWSGTREALEFFSRIAPLYLRILTAGVLVFGLVVGANWTMLGSPYTGCVSRISSEGDAAAFARGQLMARYPNFPLDPQHDPSEPWLSMNHLGQFVPVGWQSSYEFDWWLMQRIWRVEYKRSPDDAPFYAEFTECRAVRIAALA